MADKTAGGRTAGSGAANTADNAGDEAAEGTVPAARDRGLDDRRARIEALQKAKKRKERRRSVAGMAVLLIAGAAVFGKPAYEWIDEKINNPLDREIASFGVPVAGAGCDDITDDKTSGIKEHVGVGTRVEYDQVPPSSGKHYSNPVLFSARPFFTTKDSPPVENLVHNMEHGYTILWYDSTLPSEEQDEIEGVALRLRDDANYQLFIATPWDPAYGEFPEGKKVALSHWSAPTDEEDLKTSKGHRQFCDQLSGGAVQAFMDAYPATDAPERNIR